MNRLLWGDPNKTYEALGEECDILVEETRLEKQSKQLDQLYKNGSVSTALAATPEEKKLLPCFCLRDGKPCPNGSGCAYSHKNDVIDKAKNAKEEAQARTKAREKTRTRARGKARSVHTSMVFGRLT